MTDRRQVATAVVVIALLLFASACSTDAPSSYRGPSDLLGLALETARSSFPEDATVLIQDVSPVVELDASYQDGVADDRWTVVSACSSADLIADSDLVEVAVIPSGAFTPAVEERMNDGEFRDAVTSCEG